MKKYYWLCLRTVLELEGGKQEAINDIASKIHPFEVRFNHERADPERIVTLLNWKEITEEEYQLFESERLKG